MLEYGALLFSLLILQILGVMSPGPDFIMAVKNSLQYSRRVGILTALGFAFGTLIHITYSILGLSYLISQSVILFSIIKVLGAGYLIYIGYKSLRSAGHKFSVDGKKTGETLSDLKAIKSGFLTNILNPKITIYFLSIFTLVIDPGTPMWVLGTFSAIIFTTTFLWFSLVAVFMTTPQVQSIFLRFSQWIDRALGGILILLGIKLALSSQK